MPIRDVGPIPLTGGIHLDPPTGRPNGLLRGINVEERRGYLATRRGSMFLGKAPFSSVAVGATANIVTLDDGAGNGADWSAGMVGYIGFASVVSYDGPGSFMSAYWSVSDEASEHDSLLFSYWGDDDEWHPLDCGIIWTREIFFPPAGGRLNLRIPEGWKGGTPTGLPDLSGARHWLRVVRTGGPFTVTSSTVFSTEPSGAAIAVCIFRARSGPVVLVPCIRRTVAGSFLFWYMPPITEGSLSQHPVFNTSENLWDSFNTPISPSEFIWIYIPATDDFVFYAGLKEWGRLPAASIGEPLNGEWVDGNGFLYSPEVGLTNNDYEDLQLESVWPEPSALALYAERMFIAEARTGRIWWTAPGEFASILPSDNQYRLSSRGGGVTIGMAELHGSLYIFTESGIWRATAADTVPGQESNIAFAFVSETICVSRRSIVVTDSGIVFLASDGVRMFDGQRSRVISKPVQNLFRPDSEHPHAIRRGQTSCACWHPIEEQYRLFYAKSGAKENDTCLVISLRTGSCWIWGADPVTALGVPADEDSSSPLGNEAWGPLASDCAWSVDDEAMLIVSRDGYLVKMDDGHLDMGVAKIPAKMETQHIGYGAVKDQHFKEAHFTCTRTHQGQMKITVVSNGRRLDSRTVSLERFGGSATAALGVADAAGEALLEEDEAQVPAIWRGSAKGRNHRVRVETIAPNHEGFEIASLTAKIRQ